MKRLLLLFIFVVPSLLHATPQYKKRRHSFRNGVVVFHNGDSLTCKLRFTRKVTEGLIQIKTGNHQSILTVKDVQSFFWYDSASQRTRVFVNMTFIPEFSTRPHELFVEAVYENLHFSIVNHRTLGYARNFQINPFRSKTIVDRYYLVDRTNGIILPLTKENLLLLPTSKRPEVISYIESRGLRLKNLDDFIDLLDFERSLM